MDIERLRRILKELNPIFWNAKTDSKYEGKTLIESAYGRYISALADFEPDQDFSSYPKSGHHRKQIVYDRNPKKIRFDKLFQELKECLTPYDKVYDVLRKEFPSPFAEQVLLTYENLIRNFDNIPLKAVKDWDTLVVCMSHKDFWADTIKIRLDKQTQAAMNSYQQFLKDKCSEIEDLDPLSPETKDIFIRHIDAYFEWHNNNPEEALHINDVPVKEDLNLLQDSVKRGRDEREMLLRSYFVLAVLYDGNAQSRRRPTIYFDWEYNEQDTIANNFGFSEWEDIKRAGGELNEQIWRDEISYCLKRVKKDLQRQQTMEQRLAVEIIDTLTEWASVGADNWEDKLPKEYRPNHCLEYRLSIHNKLGINPILEKLMLEGKGDAAKMLEQYRDILDKAVNTIVENLDPTSLMHLPNTELYMRAKKLSYALERALPYLGPSTQPQELQNKQGTEMQKTSINMSGDNLQPDKVLLSHIATGVDELVRNPENLQTVREKIRPFAQRWVQHNSDTENAEKKRNEHWQKVKNNPAWQDKEAGPPEKDWEWERFYLGDLGFDVGPTYEMPARYAPAVMAKLEDYIEANKQKLQRSSPATMEYQRLEKTVVEQEQNLADIRTRFDKLPDKNEGWISTAVPLDRPVQGTWVQFLWFRYTDLSDEEVFGCLRPRRKQIQPNPIDALIPEKETEKLLPPVNREREYERYYVVLTSIHDNMLTGVQSISNGIWPKELAEDVWFRFTRGQPYGPDRGFIKAAINRIKDELVGEQKKEEEQPQATMSKAARALAVLHDHPDWANKQIADAIGANEKSLPRMKGFSKAREILKTGKSDYPNGSKYPDSETGQDNLESWDNQ